MPPFGSTPPMTSGGRMPPRPALPGNPAGGPSGPGSSPALSPGDGSGNQVAAQAKLKAIMPALHDALDAFPIDSKEYKAVLNALRALAPTFGKEDQANMVPAAMQQLMQANKPKGPLAGMGGGAGGGPPPGIAMGGPSPMNLGSAGG